MSTALASRRAITRPLSRSVTIAVRAALKATSAAYDRLAPPDPGIVVLAYHRVGGGSGSTVDLDPGLFADQMAILADEGRTIPLVEAADRLSLSAGAPQLGENAAVAVTFDDGTVDFIDHALPALVEHRVPVIYYIATDFIESGRNFPANGRPMSWSALGDAVSTGLVTIGSHTHTHTVMDKLDPSEADRELTKASELIGDRLGISADHFAYPKGVFGGDAIERIVAKHHTTAALVAGGANRPGDANLLRLDRIPVQTSDGLGYFRRKITGGMRLEGAVRNAINRRRYATEAR